MKNTKRNRRQVSRKSPNSLDKWNGYPEIFSLLQLYKSLGSICSFFTEQESLDAPGKCVPFSSVFARKTFLFPQICKALNLYDTEANHNELVLFPCRCFQRLVSAPYIYRPLNLSVISMRTRVFEIRISGIL